MRISGNIPGLGGFHAAVVLVVPLASLLVGHDVPAAARGTATTAVETRECQLNIEGQAIERLTLVDAGEKETAIERPGKSISLPAGKYRLRDVELQGGFSCHEYFASDDDWIHVAAGQSAVLKAGAPLTPRISVKRSGRVLTIDHELADAAGRTYTPGTENRRAKPPAFTVFKNGQTIGSGSFEYG